MMSFQYNTSGSSLPNGTLLYLFRLRRMKHQQDSQIELVRWADLYERETKEDRN